MTSAHRYFESLLTPAQRREFRRLNRAARRRLEQPLVSMVVRAVFGTRPLPWPSDWSDWRSLENRF